MRGLPVLVVVIALLLLGCTGGAKHTAPPTAARQGTATLRALAGTPLASVAAPGTLASSYVATVPGMQDIGLFVVSASGPVRAENRAATTLLHLNQGDEIHL